MKENEPVSLQEITELQYKSYLQQIADTAQSQVDLVEFTLQQLEWYQANGYRLKFYFNPTTREPLFEPIKKKIGF